MCRLITDASLGGFGGYVHQAQVNGTIKPICFLSGKTSKSERGWSETELECGAIIWAIKKLRHWFYGTRLDIFSQNQPLM